MRRYGELAYLCLDFVRYLSGRDYFRQRQKLGKYFVDPRCYYNDLRGKAAWRGDYVNGVPALYFPSLGKSSVSPCTVLLFAIGSLDRYFLSGDEGDRVAVIHAFRWLVEHIRSGAYWEEVVIGERASDFYSLNSGMNQGLALSLLSRLWREQAFLAEREVAGEMMAAVADNMVKPIEQGGTLAFDGDDVYVCEYCRPDRTIALNGWIFGVFGLLDFVQLTGDREKGAILDATVATMARLIGTFHLDNGWPYYDNRGRICSPNYAELHIHLMDAMYRLFGHSAFLESKSRCESAYTRQNRIYFTLSKIAQKLRDTSTYGTAR